MSRARGATRGKSRTGEIKSSKFQVRCSEYLELRTSNHKHTSVATVPLVSRGDLAGLGAAGEVDHYGDIEPGVESL